MMLVREINAVDSRILRLHHLSHSAFMKWFMIQMLHIILIDSKTRRNQGVSETMVFFIIQQKRVRISLSLPVLRKKIKKHQQNIYSDLRLSSKRSTTARNLFKLISFTLMTLL
jgi:hypothetical protein